MEAVCVTAVSYVGFSGSASCIRCTTATVRSLGIHTRCPPELDAARSARCLRLRCRAGGRSGDDDQVAATDPSSESVNRILSTGYGLPSRPLLTGSACPRGWSEPGLVEESVHLWTVRASTSSSAATLPHRQQPAILTVGGVGCGAARAGGSAGKRSGSCQVRPRRRASCPRGERSGERAFESRRC